MKVTNIPFMQCENRGYVSSIDVDPNFSCSLATKVAIRLGLTGGTLVR